MTPTSIDRAKTLAKSLRTETEKEGITCPLTACQAVIAAGSGATNWQRLKKQIENGEGSTNWRTDDAAAKLAELSRIDLVRAEACIRRFQDRMNGRPNSPKPIKAYDEASHTILDQLRLEYVDGKIRAYEKSDEGNWTQIGDDDISVGYKSREYPMYARYLRRASRASDTSDPDAVLAGIRSHTDLLKPNEHHSDDLAALSKIHTFVHHALDDLIEEAVGILPGLDDAISGAKLMPFWNLDTINFYLENFQEFANLPPSYRPFIRYAHNTILENAASKIDYKTAIENGLSFPHDKAEVEPLKWLRRASPNHITRVLDQCDFMHTFMVPDEMMDNDPEQFHPAMIAAGPLFCYRESDLDVFSIIMHHIAGIKDKELAHATSGWMARLFLWQDEYQMFEDNLNDLLFHIRIQFVGLGKSYKLKGYNIIAVNPFDRDTEIFLKVIFGDLSPLQNKITGEYKGEYFIIDRGGSSIAELAITSVAPNATTKIAVAEGLSVPEHFRQIADLVGKRASDQSRRRRN